MGRGAGGAELGVLPSSGRRSSRSKPEESQVPDGDPSVDAVAPVGGERRWALHREVDSMTGGSLRALKKGSQRGRRYSGFRGSPTTAPPVSWPTARLWQPPRKNGSRARSTTRDFPTTPSSIA